MVPAQKRLFLFDRTVHKKKDFLIWLDHAQKKIIFFFIGSWTKKREYFYLIGPNTHTHTHTHTHVRIICLLGSRAKNKKSFFFLLELSAKKMIFFIWLDYVQKKKKELFARTICKKTDSFYLLGPCAKKSLSLFERTMSKNDSFIGPCAFIFLFDRTMQKNYFYLSGPCVKKLILFNW